MMLPSAAPMTLAVTRIHAARTPGRGAGLKLAAFVAGYLLVWTDFAAGAAAARCTWSGGRARDVPAGRETSADGRAGWRHGRAGAR